MHGGGVAVGKEAGADPGGLRPELKRVLSGAGCIIEADRLAGGVELKSGMEGGAGQILCDLVVRPDEQKPSGRDGGAGGDGPF